MGVDQRRTSACRGMTSTVLVAREPLDRERAPPVCMGLIPSNAQRPTTSRGVAFGVDYNCFCPYTAVGLEDCNYRSLELFSVFLFVSSTNNIYWNNRWNNEACWSMPSMVGSEWVDWKLWNQWLGACVVRIMVGYSIRASLIQLLIEPLIVSILKKKNKSPMVGLQLDDWYGVLITLILEPNR